MLTNPFSVPETVPVAPANWVSPPPIVPLEVKVARLTTLPFTVPLLLKVPLLRTCPAITPLAVVASVPSSIRVWPV